GRGRKSSGDAGERVGGGEEKGVQRYQSAKIPPRKPPVQEATRICLPTTFPQAASFHSLESSRTCLVEHVLPKLLQQRSKTRMATSGKNITRAGNRYRIRLSDPRPRAL